MNRKDKRDAREGRLAPRPITSLSTPLAMATPEPPAGYARCRCISPEAHARKHAGDRPLAQD